MERITIATAKKILGNRIFGPIELDSIANKLGIASPIKFNTEIPCIPFSEIELNSILEDHFLVLFVPHQPDNSTKITLNYFRTFFSVDPNVNEPCMYNQDWYVNEKFANQCNIDIGWYLIKSNVLESTRAKMPNKNEVKKYPPALLVTYFFFANYLINGQISFKNDFVWTSDVDSNNDQIYVGRYCDPNGIAKNGFSVHRFLSINYNYASIV